MRVSARRARNSSSVWRRTTGMGHPSITTAALLWRPQHSNWVRCWLGAMPTAGLQGRSLLLSPAACSPAGEVGSSTVSPSHPPLSLMAPRPHTRRRRHPMLHPRRPARPGSNPPVNAQEQGLSIQENQDRTEGCAALPVRGQSPLGRAVGQQGTSWSANRSGQMTQTHGPKAEDPV